MTLPLVVARHGIAEATSSMAWDYFITPFIHLILRGILKAQKRGGSSWHNSLPLFVSEAKIEVCAT